MNAWTHKLETKSPATTSFLLINAHKYQCQSSRHMFKNTQTHESSVHTLSCLHIMGKRLPFKATWRNVTQLCKIISLLSLIMKSFIQLSVHQHNLLHGKVTCLKRDNCCVHACARAHTHTHMHTQRHTYTTTTHTHTHMYTFFLIKVPPLCAEVQRERGEETKSDTVWCDRQKKHNGHVCLFSTVVSLQHHLIECKHLSVTTVPQCFHVHQQICSFTQWVFTCNNLHN